MQQLSYHKLWGPTSCRVFQVLGDLQPSPAVAPQRVSWLSPTSSGADPPIRCDASRASPGKREDLKTSWDQKTIGYFNMAILENTLYLYGFSMGFIGIYYDLIWFNMVQYLHFRILELSFHEDTKESPALEETYTVFWPPLMIAKLVHIQITLVYGTGITIVNQVYKPIYNWGGSHCMGR